MSRMVTLGPMECTSSNGGPSRCLCVRVHHAISDAATSGWPTIRARLLPPEPKVFDRCRSSNVSGSKLLKSSHQGRWFPDSRLGQSTVIVHLDLSRGRWHASCRLLAITYPPLVRHRESLRALKCKNLFCSLWRHAHAPGLVGFPRRKSRMLLAKS